MAIQLDAHQQHCVIGASATFAAALRIPFPRVCKTAPTLSYSLNATSSGMAAILETGHKAWDTGIDSFHSFNYTLMTSSLLHCDSTKPPRAPLPPTMPTPSPAAWYVLRTVVLALVLILLLLDSLAPLAFVTNVERMRRTALSGLARGASSTRGKSTCSSTVYVITYDKLLLFLTLGHCLWYSTGRAARVRRRRSDSAHQRRWQSGPVYYVSACTFWIVACA